LIDCASRELKQNWSAPSGSKITVANANLSQVVVALTGGELVHLDLNIAQKQLVCVIHRHGKRSSECMGESWFD